MTLTHTFNKIFVLYPRGLRTGGPEALHQLVDALRAQGQEAVLVPLPGWHGRPRVTAYEHYDAPELDAVEDVPGNAVIAPEIAASELTSYRHAVPICWWLSIDNAFEFVEERRRAVLWPSERTLKTSRPALVAIELVRRARAKILGRSLDFGSTLHLAQSAYAAAYLFTRKNVPASIVSDYTPSDLLELVDSSGPTVRRPAVAYNPAKAAKVTAALAKRMPDVEFVPIANMTRNEVVDTLQSVAIYLDLGFHPGKDRMPREAALCGAVTLVVRRGSAAFQADVPLPWEHKIPAAAESVIPAAERAIRTVLADLPAAQAAQENYREEIRRERTTFFDEVRSTLIQGQFEAALPDRR